MWIDRPAVRAANNTPNKHPGQCHSSVRCPPPPPSFTSSIRAVASLLVHCQMCLPLGRSRKAGKRVGGKDPAKASFGTQAHRAAPMPRTDAVDVTTSLGHLVVEPWGQSLPPASAAQSSRSGTPNTSQALLTVFEAQRQRHHREYEHTQQRISADHNSRCEVVRSKLAWWLLHANHYRVEVRMEWNKLLQNFGTEFEDTADTSLKQRVADWTREISARIDRFRTDSLCLLAETLQALEQTQTETPRAANVGRGFALFGSGPRTESFEAVSKE